MFLFTDEVFDQFTNFILTPNADFFTKTSVFVEFGAFGTLHVSSFSTMSGAKRSANNSGSKRSLPSWTCSKENEGENSEKKQTFDGKGEKFNEGEAPEMGKVQNENGGKSSASSLEFRSFNKLLVGFGFACIAIFECLLADSLV